MTIIAAVKDRNEGCIVSDIRLTSSGTKTQIDIAEKFRFFENRIAIYIAGDVFVLEKIIDLLNTISASITFDNIDAEQGPFISEIISYFNSQNPSNCSFITVYLDHESSNFKMFRFDFTKENSGWDFNLIQDSMFDFEIIGSGEVILEKDFFPKLPQLSLSSIYKETKRRNPDQLLAVDSIIQSIKKRLNILGADSYKILGISPIFERTTICDSSLEVWGGNIIGESIDTSNIDNYKKWDYTIKKNSERVQIIDNLSGQELQLSQITDELYDLIVDSPSKTFDPSQEEGLSFFSPYIINQHPMYDLSMNKTTILRRVIKITKKSYKGFNLQVKENLKTQITTYKGFVQLPSIELLPFSIGDYSSEFENEINGSSLFDNNLMEKYFGTNNPLKIP